MAADGGCLSNVLRNIDNIRRIAFDIGQTTVKIAYTTSIGRLRTENGRMVCDSQKNLLRLHCIQFRLEDFETILTYIAENGKISSTKATFSASQSVPQFEVLIQSKLKLELVPTNQMDCLVRGTNFLIRNIEAESFTYHHHNDSCKYHFETFRPSTICPYLLVNVGTGISVFKVESNAKYERVGGSSLGGGSFFGLAQLLTESQTDLEGLLRMAEEGDHRAIDILVSDIYGVSYGNLGLSGDLIAGSFGKCTKKENANKVKESKDYKKNVVRSLLLMISNSIGQFAVLYAQKEKVKRIYFDGFLIRNHAIIMRTISFAIKFWSEGKHEAHFLRHEGYTTAIGAFLKGGEFIEADAPYGTKNEADKLSWHEHYTGCTDLGRFVPTAPLSAGFTAIGLELECADIQLRPFPLLAEKEERYTPDVVDLSQNAEDREFWIQTMIDSVAKVMTKACESQFDSDDAQQRAEGFREKFNAKMEMIRDKSFAFGSCTVRNLLDLREQILNEQGFDDSFLAQKTMENDMALKEFPGILAIIDKEKNAEKRLELVSLGLLAGNVFDWGARKVIDLFESEEGLTFSKALSTLPARPWLIDTYDNFAASVNKAPYKCVAIFVDNSGADFVLGVLPFAREILRRGTKVIIVSNQKPALNDLTYTEMISMIPRIKSLDDVLKKAIEDEQLMFHHSGQESPCLDLRKVHSELNKAVLEHEVDLVVIEGMGRALHTNLNAKFTCDVLKAAVIKSQWLADKMGGQLFSVVFKFEKGIC